MSGKRFSNEKAKKNGFYAALAICLMAVGVAAWSTYDAVGGYMEENGTISQAAAGTVSKAPSVSSKVENTEDGEALKRNETQSAVSERAEETAGSTVASEVPVESTLPESSEEASAEQAPANTGVLYEITEVMALPVNAGKIINAYSCGAPVYSVTMRDWRIHNGIDIQAAVGEEVKACGNGQVQEIFTDSMLGNVAAVEHGEYVFYYCGLGENMEVEAGDIVSAGQTIGVISVVPAEAAEEPHLHLEVKRDGVYLNPEEIMQKVEN